MPIRPENKHRYPSNWKEIRARILQRAGNHCEECGLVNHSYGYRDGKGNFTECDIEDGDSIFEMYGYKVIRIVLTIAHLDHIEEHCEDSNLKALCQQCHNRLDAKVRAAGIINRKRQNYAIGDLL